MAKEFRAHVSKLLKEQRLKLGEEMKNQSLLEVAKEREIHLLEKFKDCAGVYFINNPILRLCKFGSSKNVSKRVKEHRRDFGDEFRLHHVVKTPKYADLENGVRRFQNTEHNGHVEIIQYTNNDELQSIYKNTERESRLLSYEESNDLEIRKMEHERNMAQIDLEKLKIQLEIKRLEVAQASNISNDVAQQPPSPPNNDIHIKNIDLLDKEQLVKEFIENITEPSPNIKDYIFIDHIFGKFEQWVYDKKIEACVLRNTFNKIVNNHYISKRIDTGERTPTSRLRKIGMVYRKYK